MANAKIVVTLGPASDASETVCALIRAGAHIFRLNASHGSGSSTSGASKPFAKRRSSTGFPVGILLDLQGPKIRLGQFIAGECASADGRASPSPPTNHGR